MYCYLLTTCLQSSKCYDYTPFITTLVKIQHIISILLFQHTTFYQTQLPYFHDHRCPSINVVRKWYRGFENRNSLASSHPHIQSIHQMMHIVSYIHCCMCPKLYLLFPLNTTYTSGHIFPNLSLRIT